MASIEDQHAVYNDDDLDDDEDDEESGPPQNEVVVDEDDDIDVEDDEDSTSSPPPPPPPPLSNHSAADEVTIAVVGVPASDSPKRQQINEFGVTPASTATAEEKKPLALDDSRKLFQRLWTDEDEIELLQGFLEYTTQRGGINSSSHHHDTTAFYDQIKSKLQLDFNKNQLVEKLRRLKKKYRNVMSKMGSGKEFVFKSSHDQTTFDISCKIWSNAGPIVIRRPEDGGFDDEDSHLNLNANFIDHSPNFNLHPNPDGLYAKSSKSRKRSRGGAIKVEEKPVFIQQFYQASGGGTKPILPMSSSPALMYNHLPMAGPQGTVPPMATAAVEGASIPSLIEETVRSCLSPIFKELLNNIANLNGSRSFGFGMTLGPTPLGFGSSAMSSSSDLEVDEKWRKQHMLELKVYSRRLELVQDQIKAQLEELRSMSS